MAGYLFGGSTNLSYDELQQKRKVANALAAQLLGSTPKNTGEGIGAILKGIGVGVANSRTNSAENANRSAASELFNSIIGGSSGAPPTAAQGMQASAATSGVNQEMYATSPSGNVDVSKNGDTFEPFIGTVKSTITNPYGLAAVASTGKAESGWSPKNANRSWADPSESGQAGTAGGILSWRGPRLASLQSYAKSKGESGNGSPQTQAEFFLKEDPKLVQTLNSAKSVEEAQSAINRAWAFAGYNRPGGEAGRRLQYARSYLPQLQGGQQGGQQMASASPTTASDAIEAQAPSNRYVDPMVSAPNYAPTQTPSPDPRSQGGFDPGRFGDSAPAPQIYTQPSDFTAYAPELPPARNIAPAPAVAAAPQVAQVQDRQQAPPNTPSQQNGVDPRLYQALANPWLNDGQKASIQAVIQQQQQAADRQANEQTWRQRNEYEQQQRQNDPAYQLNLKRTQVEIDQAMKPGYRVLQQEERTAFGIPPDDTRPYQVSREGQISAIGGMGQTQTPGVEARQREALAQQYGIDPKSAEGQRFILTGTLPTSDRGVTAGDREAIRDADDMVNSGQATLGLLDRAMELSGKAYEGVGAEARALVASQWGDEGALATREYDNIVKEQALGQLKSIFGGNPTEGERAILLEIQGSSGQPKPVRDSILKRARAAVERRVKFNQDRANELRGGTYYKPRQQGNETAQPPADKPISEMTDEELKALANGG